MVILDMSDELASIQSMPMYIFGRNTKEKFATPLYRRIYYLNTIENNNLIKSFIPCYRKIAGVAELFDTVNSEFYINQGIGTFEKGNDV